VENGVVKETRDYMENFEYKDDKIEHIHHAEGVITRRALRSGESTEFVGLGGLVWQYEYTLKDHLGNTRVTFADLDGNRTIDPNTEISQINHYAPFGMNLEGNWNGAAGSNKYQLTGKEWNDDFGLGMNDFGARMYDPTIGRWNAVDLMAAKYSFQNPYNYVSNNPINMIDPDGKDNILYLVTLPGVDNEVKKNLANRVNDMVKNSKVNVQIHMVNNSEKFDISKIDKTDAVAVIGGTKTEATDYIRKNFAGKGHVSDGFINGKDEARSLSSWLTTPLNPEITDGGDVKGWSFVTAITTQGKDKMDKISPNDATSFVDVVQALGVNNMTSLTAFAILHGLGHLAGIDHGYGTRSFGVFGSSFI
jgi:RHS repeat-associated protein